jgi:hypothetical protein
VRLRIANNNKKKSPKTQVEKHRKAYKNEHKFLGKMSINFMPILHKNRIKTAKSMHKRGIMNQNAFSLC